MIIPECYDSLIGLFITIEKIIGKTYIYIVDIASKHYFVGRYEYSINTPSKKWVIEHGFNHCNISAMVYSGGCLINASCCLTYHTDRVEVDFEIPTEGILVLMNNIEQALWIMICKIESGQL